MRKLLSRMYQDVSLYLSGNMNLHVKYHREVKAFTTIISKRILLVFEMRRLRFECPVLNRSILKSKSRILYLVGVGGSLQMVV